MAQRKEEYRVDRGEVVKLSEGGDFVSRATGNVESKAQLSSGATGYGNGKDRADADRRAIDDARQNELKEMFERDR
jgi:hypothetical protein